MNEDRLLERVANDLADHPLRSNSAHSAAAGIREIAHHLAVVIVQLTPNCRERAKALSRLDETVMYAVAALARNQPPVSAPIDVDATETAP